MNLDPILNTHIDAIQSRLANAELNWFGITGATLRKIYETPHDQLPSLLYSGKVGEMTSADLHRIKRELDRAHRANIAEMSTLFRDLTAEVYETGQEMSREKGVEISNKTAYRQSVNPLLQQAYKDYEVMGRSTTVDTTYRQTVNRYVNNLMTGDEEYYPVALRKAIRELTAEGISTIDYKSGRSVRMDSAIRNSLMTEYTNIVQQVERKLGEEIGSDGVEISAHQHSAEDHEPFQGRTFTNEEFEKLQNGDMAEDIEGETFQTDRPIGMWNCRHLWFPVLIGISEPSHSLEELEAMKQINDDGVEFHGKHFTLYEAEQQQRILESSMRRERENLNLLKEVRDTDPRFEREYQKSRARLAELRGEYKELGAVLAPKAIRMKMERAYVPRGSVGDIRNLAPGQPVVMGDNIARPLGDDFSAALEKRISKAPQEFQDAWNNLSGEINVIDSNYQGTPYYSPKQNGIYFNAELDRNSQTYRMADGNEYTKPAYSDAFHEMFHNLSKAAAARSGASPLSDYADVFKSSQYNSTLTQMLEREMKEFTSKARGILASNSGVDVKSIKTADVYEAMNKQLKGLSGNKAADVSDLFEGLTNGKVGGWNNNMMGHGRDYWKTHTVGVEAFAHFGNAGINFQESLPLIKLIFPKSYDIFIEAVKSMGTLR